MGEVLTSSFSAPSRRLNVISPIPAPVSFPHRERAPRDEEQGQSTNCLLFTVYCLLLTEKAVYC